MLSEILKIVIEACASILGIGITYLLGKYVSPYIISIMKNWIVNKAVKAAEKIYQDSGMGEKKKEYVTKLLTSIGVMKLNADGSIPDLWNALIEAAVKELDLLEDSIGKSVDTTETVVTTDSSSTK